MKFEKELIHAKFLKRYKRFFADIVLSSNTQANAVDENHVEVAHVANTGSLKGVIQNEGQLCLVKKHEDPKRKLKYSLEAMQDLQSKNWIGVNTSLPNQSMKEIFNGLVLKAKCSFDLEKILFENPHWESIQEVKAEHAINKVTRLDFRLKMKNQNNPNLFHFVEIKNVTMKALVNNQSHAQFPDSVTERGQKHLTELINLVDEGHTCEIIFFVQRSDVDFFSAASQIDEVYAKLLKKASDRGVLVTPLVFAINESGLSYVKKLKFRN